MRKKIEITKSTKGIVVFAQSKCYKNDGWIILIKNVLEHGRDNFHIIRHISYDISDGEVYSDGNYEGSWGFTRGYDFYLATDEEKQIIMDILAKRRKKFVKILNQIIDR